jgi:hypothetical protein
VTYENVARLPAQAPPPDQTTEPEAEVGFDYAKAFGYAKNIKTPRGYRVNRGGVSILRPASKGDDVWVRFTFEPLVVTATFEDPEGEQYVELSWTDRSRGERRVISRIVSREIAKRGRELIRQLGGSGLPAVEGDSRQVERWLAEFEAANRAAIPSEQLAHWLGWQPDGSFVASPHGPVKVDVVFDEQKGPARAHGCRGTLADWQKTIKGLERYPVPRATLAAAFAAPLLRLLGINSFTLDVSSRSTKGKTTALQCALSVWANPSEQSDAMSNWRTTLYAIEKRLNLVRGIITVFDETMAVNDETLIDKVLYQLPMNHGTARSGGAFASMLPWETILLSSGERPALSFTTAQGAAARILGTTLPPFGNNGGQAAIAAREGVLANFGHAGPRFIAHVCTLKSQPGGFEGIKDRHGVLTEKFRGENDMTARRAPMVAALVLAEELAHAAGLLPYKPMSEDQWRRLFAAHNPTDDRPEMAMEVVREYVAAHAWELWPRPLYDERPPPPRGWLGAVKTSGKERRVAILPERLRGILADAGYSLDAVLGGWIDAGYVELRPSQRPQHLIPTSFDGRKAKCVQFTTAALPEGEEQEGL